MSIKLNLGSGRTRYDGFLNCDFDTNCDVDYTFNIETDTWPFDDNSVDEVKAYHIMEHMGDGYFHFLKELYRVCKDKAIIDIQVPHHRHDNFFHDPTHKRPITFFGLKMFDKYFNYGDTSSTSKLGILYDVDFRILEHSQPLDGRFAYLYGQPEEAIEFFAYSRCNVYVESHFKVQVRKCDSREYKIMELFSTILKRGIAPKDLEYYMNEDSTIEQIEQSLLNSDEYKRLTHNLK